MNVAVTKGNKRWMGWSIHAAGAVALFLTSLLYALPAGAAPGRPAIRSGNPVDGNPPVSTANLATDKARYAPGQVVQITGSGFAPSESVKLRIALQSNLKSGSQNLDAWTVAAPNGAITTQWVIPAGYINDSLVVAATGTASGEWGLAGFTSANTNLTLSSALRDTLCGSAGDSIDVCVTLTQSCNVDPDQPLPGREVIFFVNPGNCGANVGQVAEDTAITDAFGVACDRLAIPLAPGTYTLRAKFRGEDPPDPCPLPGNNACDPNDGDANKRCTNLSSANLCQKFEANTPCCGNRPPVTFAPPDFAISACEGDTICTFPWSETDPDGNIMSFFIPFGFMPASGRICFVVDTAGVYQIICCAVDACGLQGCDTMYVTVTLNRKPDIALGNDTTFVLCSSVPICLPYTVSDPDGLAGLTEYLVWGPPGATIDTALNKVCFTPTVSGKDTVIVTVTDHCGAVDSDTIVINALLNHPPTIDLGPDKTITQCTQAPICCFYSVADPDGLDGLIESLISGPPNASIDTAGNKVCFTPTASGDYSIIVRVIDPCDQADYDTSVVHVTLNGPPDIAFGNDSTIVQCTPSQICAPYTISDPNELGHLTEMLLSGPPAARLDTLNNKVCFTPTISGIYTIIAKVSDSCGAEDRDTINFTVTVNGPPTIDLGADKNIAQCTAGQICCPYTVSDPNGLGKLSEFLIAGPSGAFIDTLNNKICFTPTGSGCQTIIAKAIDSCGVNDYDTTVVCVTLNAPPDIAFGHDSTLTQCTPVQICASYTISDPNGLSHLSELLLSGPPAAFLDTLNNKVCFTPSGSGAYTIIAKVTDSCGAEDRDTIVYTINQGTPPSIDLGPDQNAIQCAASAICVTYTVSGSQPLTEALVSGPANASIDTVANKICFTPAGSGCNTIIAKVTNGCGASDLDTVVVL
ncbi:MAG: hypothetical protein HY304_03450 [candidate division Zixibacteria bacterium]|nr:hypothetical protein [candidate division Zixibacteria bacterium]